jgi:hypothetical protein
MEISASAGAPHADPRVEREHSPRKSEERVGVHLLDRREVVRDLRDEGGSSNQRAAEEVA